MAEERAGCNARAGPDAVGNRERPDPIPEHAVDDHIDAAV